MSSPPEIYKNYPTNLPHLSLEQLQALHDYNEELIKAEARDDLRTMTHEQTFPSNDSPQNVGAATVVDVGKQSNSWKQRDDEITRALCDDPLDKQKRWETLHRQWAVAKAAINTEAGPSREHFYYESHVDPRFLQASAAMRQHEIDQNLAMSAFLYLQDQERQSQKNSTVHDSLPGLNFSEQEQRHALSTVYAQPTSLPLSHEASNEPLALSSPPCPTNVNQEQAESIPGRVAPPNTPMQYPLPDALPDEVTKDDSQFKINLPSISFLPQAGDDYPGSMIHFPSLSYILQNNTNLPDHQTQDATHYNGDSKYQHNSKSSTRPQADLYLLTTKSDPWTNFSASVTPSTCTALVSPTDNVPTNRTYMPSLPKTSQKAKQPGSSESKSTKKGTKPKKPKKPPAPTRRWSHTYLNRLMHKHRPENLPEDVQLTDHTEVQDISIERLSPPITAVDAENDGVIVFFGAGTRFEMPIDVEVGYGRAVSENASAVHTKESQAVVKVTPFRLVVMDKEGNISIDLSWEAEVAPRDPVL